MKSYKFITVQENSYLLGVFFYQAERKLQYSSEKGFNRFTQIAEWLSMAAGVVEVVMDVGRYDVDLWCCGVARDHVRDVEKTYSLFSKQLIIFQFIWNSFELLVKCIYGENEYRHSKSRFILDEVIPCIDRKFYVNGYLEVVNLLYEMVKCSVRFKSLWDNIEIKNSHFYGSGLYIVNKIRNMFVHGSLCVPPSERDTGVEPLDEKLIEVSSRIILLTMQMISLHNFETETFEIWISNEEYFSCREIDMHKYLREMHLRKRFLREDQCKLL